MLLLDQASHAVSLFRGLSEAVCSTDLLSLTFYVTLQMFLGTIKKRSHKACSPKVPTRSISFLYLLVGATLYCKLEAGEVCTKTCSS